MKLNIPHVEALASFLETLDPELFSMASWGYDMPCNTPACIAGWACRLAKTHQSSYQAASWLLEPGASDCDWDTIYSSLFVAHNIYFDSVTPQIAAQVLRNLLATGEISWPPETHRAAA